MLTSTNKSYNTHKHKLQSIFKGKSYPNLFRIYQNTIAVVFTRSNYPHTLYIQDKPTKTRASLTEIMHLLKTVKYVGIIYQTNCFLQWKELLQSNIKYVKVHNIKKVNKGILLVT
jgi:hypothetical protein